MAAKARAETNDERNLRAEYLKAELIVCEGGKLSQSQAAARRKWQKLEQERLEDEFLQAIPVRRFLDMLGTGATRNKVPELFRSLGLPSFGKAVDLYEHLAAIFKLISTNRKLLTEDDAEAAERQLRETKTKLETEKLRLDLERKKLEREELTSSRVSHDDVADLVAVITQHIKRLGDRLGRRNRLSPGDAQRMLNTTIDAIVREYESSKQT